MLLSIVVNHSFASLKYVRTEQIVPVNYLESLSGSLSYCLGAFFMISGYYIYFPPSEKFGFANLLKKKTRSLIFPYLLWNSIYIVIFITSSFLLPVMKDRCKELQLFTPWGVVDGLLGITHHPSDGPLWYLRSLFCCIIFYPLLRYLCKQRLGILIILVLAIGLGMLYPKMSPAVAEHFKPYILPSFCLGIYLRERDISLHVFERCQWAAILIFALVMASLLKLVNFIPLTWIIEHRLVYLLMIPFWMMLSQILTFSNESFYQRILVPATFFIYASHALFGVAILRLLTSHIPESPFKALILTSAFLILGGGCIFLSNMVLRKIPYVYMLLTGGRNG